MSHPFYLAYGVLLLGLVGVAEYRGLSLNSINQVNNVPRTVRDNPGAYRSHYAFLPRYIGGK
ncbi:MAG: hypothetical protein NT090_19340 [Acidobacteria bacterium]|jgi:hypothetical protein|nr:hypothetical protein [Acidobacteriota bacterium]